MKIYNGPYLTISFEKEHDRLVQFWSISPSCITSFKEEMLMYTAFYKQYKPSQALWLQTNFRLQLDDKTIHWIEKNVNIPCVEYGNKKAAFVVGKDVLAHLKVIDSFEQTDSVVQPFHFASEEDARSWLDESLKPIQDNTETEIRFEGLDENGNLIIKIKKSSDSIKNTIKLFKDLIEDKEFIKNNIDKYTSLTKREKELLRLRTQGIAYKTISGRLCISLHTVNTHFRNIKKKLAIDTFNDILKYKKHFDL